MIGKKITDYTGQYKWRALLIACLGSLVGVINGSTLIIALPTMMVKLNTTLIGVMGVLIVYMVILTILSPACGRFADMHGRKRIYLAGMATFTIGSLLCAFSADLPQLLLFRVVQAIGGAILVANGSIIVADAFPRHELGRAMGVLSMIIAAAFVLGPILGGVLTMIDWRLNFLFNVPFGVAAVIAGWFWLKDVVPIKEVERFDYLGMALFTVALVGLLGYVTVGFLVGFFSPMMLGILAFGSLGFVTFYNREKVFSHPLLDLSLFKIRTFTYGQFSNLLNAIARGAVMILLILYFQGVRGYDPFWASILTAPLAVGIVISGPIGGSLSDRHGSRLISTGGLAISLIGLA
ncbi:MAG TPA: MFS transporter, partial [Methanomicrobiales archaeon]|nr:MFS transporter [Methanomicrobiales archaeon]